MFRGVLYASSSVALYMLCSIFQKIRATPDDSAIDHEEDEMKKGLSDKKDKWFFDMGFNIAYTLVIYCLILIYSQIAPLITIFGFLYFTNKYWIDKYNLMYVYPKEYGGQGKLYQEIAGQQYVSILISQLVVFGFLLSIFGRTSTLLEIAGLQGLLVLVNWILSRDCCRKNVIRCKK